MRYLVAIASFLLTTAIVAGFLGSFHPAFDSFAHFRAHLCVAAGLFGIALMTQRLRREGLSVLALAVFTGSTAAPAWTGSDGAAASTPGLKVLHANLRFDNREADAVLALIEREMPDAILLAEVSDRWKQRLSETLPQWPYRLVCPGRGAIGGTAILSRLPFSAAVPTACHDDGGLAIGSVDLAGHPVALAELHLHWPWPSRQMSEIEAISALLSELPPDTLLAGDFNAAPWSAAVGRVARAGGLLVTDGIGGTWLPEEISSWRRFGLPIDNVLHGRDLTVAAHTLELPGSDHRAVSIRVAHRNR